MNSLDLINHLRQCSLEEFHTKLDKLQTRHPEKYEVLENFILSLKPKEPLKE
jgi:hypothetical protein